MTDTTGIQDEIVGLLMINDTLPASVEIYPDGRDGATEMFMVVLNYGWAQRNLAEGLYGGDARAVAFSLSALLAGAGHVCPVNRGGDEFTDV